MLGFVLNVKSISVCHTQNVANDISKKKLLISWQIFVLSRLDNL